MDTLNDADAISVLPYAIDKHGTFLGVRRRGLIQGLTDRGRLDLLAQLRFPEVGIVELCTLRGFPLPRAMLLTAVQSFQARFPTLGMAGLLAWVMLDSPVALLPEDGKVPLLLLQYFYEKSIPISEGCIFTDGLDSFSVLFWQYLTKRDPREFGELLELALKHGDHKSSLLARGCRTWHPDYKLDNSEEDVYLAVLIHLHHIRNANEHAVENCDNMLARRQTTGYHCMCCDRLSAVRTS